MTTFKGFTIDKVTKNDWVIYKDGKYIEELNNNYKDQRMCSTLKEAKARITKYIEG